MTEGTFSKVLETYQAAWEADGREGIEPKALMRAPWAPGSEAKDDIFVRYRMEISGRDIPEAVEYFTVVPVIVERDKSGRPLVVGVMQALERRDGLLIVPYRPIAEVDSARNPKTPT